MTEAKNDILELAAKIEKSLEIDKKAGVITEGSEKAYLGNLPEGITAETVTTIQDYNTNFVAAATQAVGNMAVAAMKSNKELPVVTASIALGGKDEMSVAVERSHEYPNTLGGKDAPPTVKFGQTTVKIEARAGKNAGQLKVVRNAINDLAAAELK